MIDVRFSGKKRSMWRRVPEEFFSPERGWLSMEVKVTAMDGAVIIMYWYIKGSMNAWFAHVQPQF